jgi:Na+-translocating ferredoxin:NAD+ oxidoreductase RnfD subunit
VNGRTITIGGTSYPLTLPSARDARLHVAAVIVTIHVLGQVTLGFQVSVPQILAAIVTCAAMEVAITFHRQRAFVWPASAMLTGSGVALILRVPSTPPGEPWTFHAWWVFAGVAAFSLSTKYLIRYRGSHVFNPSNVGLVVVFLVFGSTRVEPLDFWWAPLDAGMIAAYLVILGGGVAISWRLGLAASALTFWLTLAAGTAVLAASGHCMVARWAFSPVCGFDYWRVIVTSPEVLVFMFFMLTDPKTVSTGRVGRVVFGFVVGVASTLLMAPQANEYGTKVALLAGLTVVCAGRWILDRFLPEPRSSADRVLGFGRRLVAGAGDVVPGRTVARGGLLLAALATIAAGIVIAGSPARGVVVPAVDDVLGRAPSDVDPSTFPSIAVDDDVVSWNHEITGDGAREIVLTLVENLGLEAQAMRDGDPDLLEAVDHGDRLSEMQSLLDEQAAEGVRVVERYDIDDVRVRLIVPFGRQDGLSLGLDSTGTRTTETYDVRDGGDELRSRTSEPFETTFVMRRATGARWLDVAVVPYGSEP